jgi:hypothetical protein
MGEASSIFIFPALTNRSANYSVEASREETRATLGSRVGVGMPTYG